MPLKKLRVLACTRVGARALRDTSRATLQRACHRVAQRIVPVLLCMAHERARELPVARKLVILREMSFLICYISVNVWF